MAICRKGGRTDRKGGRVYRTCGRMRRISGWMRRIGGALLKGDAGAFLDCHIHGSHSSESIALDPRNGWFSTRETLGSEARNGAPFSSE